MMVKSIPVRSVIDAVAGASAAWCDVRYAPRRRAVDAVSNRTGYSPPVVEFAFDRLFRSLGGDAIAAVIAAELGSLEVLDGFVDLGARGMTRALPIGRVCVISSRTTIGVAIVPAIFALCAKCDVLVKDRDDHLVAAFFATLTEILAQLGDAVAARPWLGESDDVNLDAFDSIVAFGSDRTLAAISGALRFPARLISYPSKLSAGYLSSQALATRGAAETVTRGAARDMLLYDGEGCLSLRALFIERGANVSPLQFCEMLRDAVELTATEFPATASARSSAQLAMARDTASFRMAPGEHIFTNAQSSYLLLFDPPLDGPPLLTPRALSVYSVADPHEAAAYLRRHGIALEALAVAQPADAALCSVAASLGASRITAFGSLQNPPLAAFHGGRPRVAEFVRWISDET
ncbi:MAG TPA: acyl-CoA reductase [Candidatus Cybelea sp.]|nr:acyl-CoA reductase [Candidatus Cybelea sp.]